MCAVGALVLIGVGEQQVAVSRVVGAPGSTRLGVVTDSCNEDPRVRTEQTSTDVRVSAYVRRRPLIGGRGSCTDTTWVTLQSPLEGRTVVDTSTSAELVPTDW